MTDNNIRRYEFESAEAVEDAKTILSTKDTEGVVRVAVEVEYASDDTESDTEDAGIMTKTQAISELTGRLRATPIMEVIAEQGTEDDPITNKEISQHVDIDHDNVSPHTARLYEGGLVDRKQVEHGAYAYWPTQKGIREVRSL